MRRRQRRGERGRGTSAAVARGDASAFAGWPLARALDALLRLCHDLFRHAVGGAARYFPQHVIASITTSVFALEPWRVSLLRASRHDGHAWNEGLLLESLCAQGARAMNGGTRAAVA